jgi:feruloyl esterase
MNLNSPTLRRAAAAMRPDGSGLAIIALVAAAFAGAQPAAHPGAARALQPAAFIPAKLDCDALLQDGGRRNPHVPDFQEIPGAPARITSTRIVQAAAAEPEYCEVTGYVQTQVKFQLKLPTKTWQGRYLQFGCSGYCGMIPRTAFPSTRGELGGVFALGATNTGHDTAQMTDALWAGGVEQARIDYGYRGVHVTALAAKAILTAYYGRPPVRSYWIGCSCGGREGLMEAQRYPRDFDGIVAGAPASLQTFNPIYMAWALRANTDANGQIILTADKLAPLHAAVVKACDGNDGVVGDGLIGDPRDCNFDPASIQCAAGDQPDCLTAAQARVAKTYYTGNYDSQGRRLDPRVLPYGSELSWAGFWVPRAPSAHDPNGARRSLGAWAFGDNAARWFSFPIGQGKSLDQVQLTVEELRRMASQAKYYEPLDPDLNAFRQAGGKLMLYQGLADWGVTPSQTLMYYDALRRAMGGQEQTDAFARLFMIPGMSHCGGGPTPDTSQMLLQMVRWVENQQAPESVLVADRNPAAGTIRRRPVFRYPLVARYIGPNPAQNPTGPDQPENFVATARAKPPADSIDWAASYLLTPGAHADVRPPTSLTGRP